MEERTMSKNQEDLLSEKKDFQAVFAYVAD